MTVTGIPTEGVAIAGVASVPRALTGQVRHEKSTITSNTDCPMIQVLVNARSAIRPSATCPACWRAARAASRRFALPIADAASAANSAPSSNERREPRRQVAQQPVRAKPQHCPNGHTQARADEPRRRREIEAAGDVARSPQGREPQ